MFTSESLYASLIDCFLTSINFNVVFTSKNAKQSRVTCWQYVYISLIALLRMTHSFVFWEILARQLTWPIDYFPKRCRIRRANLGKYEFLLLHASCKSRFYNKFRHILRATRMSATNASSAEKAIGFFSVLAENSLVTKHRYTLHMYIGYII